jgi:hypothetical protein
MSKRIPTFVLCLLLVTANASAIFSQSTVTPADYKNFALPLSDGSEGKAIFLPTADGRRFLVYSTPTGQIGFLTTGTATIDPSPTPTPVPTPTPTPVAVKLQVITVAKTEAEKIPAEVEQYLTAGSGTYSAFWTEQVLDENTETIALRWIGLSAGHNYPYTFIADESGKILWQGETPSTSKTFIELLKTYGKQSPRKKEINKCNECLENSQPSRTRGIFNLRSI